MGLRASLDRFLDGTIVQVGMPDPALPYERKPKAFFRLLHPAYDQVWEIRDLHKNPKLSLRVFGRFADVDLFIALGWQSRDKLGKPTSSAWRDARVACKTAWTNLFYVYPPQIGTNLHDYISNAVPV